MRNVSFLYIFFSRKLQNISVTEFNDETAVFEDDRLSDLTYDEQDRVRRLLHGCLNVNMEKRLAADQAAVLMLPDSVVVKTE